MPIFWLGIMLIIIFAVRLKVLPASGYGTWQHFLMPAFTLGAFLAPITMRLVRSGVIEVLNMEYIKTARAKGVAESVVVVKHAFRNACIPVITVLGLQFGQLLGGAIVTETVFAWPGVATLTVDSIRNQDFPVVQCAVVLLALIIVPSIWWTRCRPDRSRVRARRRRRRASGLSSSPRDPGAAAAAPGWRSAGSGVFAAWRPLAVSLIVASVAFAPAAPQTLAVTSAMAGPSPGWPAARETSPHRPVATLLASRPGGRFPWSAFCGSHLGSSGCWGYRIRRGRNDLSS
jgi:hypothetical protein